MPSHHVRSPILAAAHMPAEPLRAHTGPMAVTIALLGAGFILLCEAMTPLALSVGCLYMLLAVHAAMRLGEIETIALLAATSVCGMIVHHLQLFGGGPTHGGLSTVEIWNSATRLVTICVFGVILRRLLLALRGERHRAARDPLTGALNRRSLYAGFEAIGHRGGWRKIVCGIVFLDLDGFKVANDRFGHAAGDALLARLAFAATGAIGERDLFARLGGDEFVALIVGGDERIVEQRIYALHERLTRALAEAQLGVTCSSGAVIARIGRGEKLDPLIMRADRLMYEVKDAGKDGVRIVCRGPTEPLIEADFDQSRPRRVRAGEDRRRTA